MDDLLNDHQPAPASAFPWARASFLALLLLVASFSVRFVVSVAVALTLDSRVESSFGRLVYTLLPPVALLAAVYFLTKRSVTFGQSGRVSQWTLFGAVSFALSALVSAPFWNVAHLGFFGPAGLQVLRAVEAVAWVVVVRVASVRALATTHGEEDVREGGEPSASESTSTVGP